MEAKEKDMELKPPYGNIAWFIKFFKVIRNKDFNKFDKDTVSLNIIGGDNARAMFMSLRFLDLVNEDGIVTDKFGRLRRTGDDFNKNLRGVVEEAYQTLLKKAAVESISENNLRNFFMDTYSFGETIANRAMKVFVYLCQQSGIPISQELASLISPKDKHKPTVQRTKSEKARASPRKKDGEIETENSIQVRFEKYQLIIPIEDIDTVKAQLEAALDYIKKKLESKTRIG